MTPEVAEQVPPPPPPTTPDEDPAGLVIGNGEGMQFELNPESAGEGWL